MRHNQFFGSKSVCLSIVAVLLSTSLALGQDRPLLDATGDETVPPSTAVQTPLPSPTGRPVAALPEQGADTTVVTIESGPNTGAQPPALPMGQEPVTQNEINQRGQPSNATPQTPVGDFPVIGATELLQSLDDLDRPLSPEEITAYGAALQSQFPMTPEMILDYRRRLDESQRAAATPPSGRFPNAITDAVHISLGPTQTPEVLLTGQDTVSVMAFYDRSGAAWPIRASNNVMMAFATGTDIPGNAVRLSTDNAAVRAWRYDGSIYLQSRETVISPPASQILTAAGQVHAYKIRPTAVVLISVNGVVSKVRIAQ